MDQIKILKRALHITINYRVLWVFGILLALTVGSGSSGGGSGNSGSKYNSSNNDGNGFNWPDGQNPFAEFQKHLTPEVINTIIGVAIALACIILVLIVIGTIVRYISETALIRMVDQYENTGEKLTVRQGFGLGRSRAAWKMFLMDLVTGLVVLAAFLTALIIAALPLVAWATKSVPLGVLGTIISVGLILLLVFAAILVELALRLILLFARRAIALEDLGILASIRRGFEIIKGRLGDIILMGVIMFGIGILWTLVMIPVFLAIFLVAALIAALPALLVAGVASLFTAGATPWIVAAIVALPIFIIVILIPGSVVGGWRQVFTSSTWTLTYREALALAKTKENGEELPASQAA